MTTTSTHSRITVRHDDHRITICDLCGSHGHHVPVGAYLEGHDRFVEFACRACLTCEAITDEAWGPHPGCSEFMDEPEAEVTCNEPATVVIAWPDDPEALALCDHHAAEVRHEEGEIVWDELTVREIG